MGQECRTRSKVLAQLQYTFSIVSGLWCFLIAVFELFMQWTFFVRFHFTEHEVLLVEGEKWRKQNKRLYIFMSEDKSKAFPVQAPTWLFLFIFSIFFRFFFFSKRDFCLISFWLICYGELKLFTGLLLHFFTFTFPSRGLTATTYLHFSSFNLGAKEVH